MKVEMARHIRAANPMILMAICMFGLLAAPVAPEDRQDKA
jgi:hypothetical protein